MRLAHLVLVSVLWTTGVFAGDPVEMPPLHHPVELEVPEAMQVAEDLPLGEGDRLACTTCHGIEEIKELPREEVDKDDPEFLRGGPYSRLSAFCANCHDREASRPLNIHAMRDAAGELVEGRCLHCHEEARDPEQPVEREALRFRLPPSKLCIGCHLKAPHLNARRHAAEPKEAMRELMQKAEREHGIVLPLDESGRVMCATCHAPHGPGVLGPDSPAGRQVADTDLDEGIVYGDSAWTRVFEADKRERLDQLEQTVPPLTYRRVEKEVLLRLPAKDGRLCSACHEFDK